MINYSQIFLEFKTVGRFAFVEQFALRISF